MHPLQTTDHGAFDCQHEQESTYVIDVRWILAAHTSMRRPHCKQLTHSVTKVSFSQYQNDKDLNRLVISPLWLRSKINKGLWGHSCRLEAVS